MNYTTKTPGIHWSASTKRVDKDTGEQITEYVAKRYYITHKTTKHVTLNNLKTRGHIEHTIEYRRKPQLELFETD